jgi:alkylation response protein AidB-like acyl-CoA dehydrogenase
MTMIDRNLTTGADVANNARALGPTINARTAEIDAARRLPSDLLDELIRAGCFRLLLPRSHSGLGADVRTALDVFEALARADASVGWTTMIGAGSWCDLATLPRATFDAIFDGSDVIMAGVFNPAGSMEPVAGGYRVTGRWGFASGCEHATWLFGNCVEGVTDGVPHLRGAVFAPADVVIEDTWNVVGLRGTGSHHFRADGVMVPSDRTFVPMGEDRCIDEPIVRIPAPPLFSLAIASIATGTAQGALDDIIAIAAGKVPLLEATPLATNPLFQYELAVAVTELSAARALMHETAEEMWSTAVHGNPFTLEWRAHVRAAAAWITARCAAVVDVAYRSGGGTAVYADCSLQRRLRDVHAITQHFLVKPYTLTTAGAIFAGQDPAVLVF